MAFDSTFRRLITGASDGSVKVWNFNNGALVRDCEVKDDKEVSCITCTTDRILTAGWNARVVQYMDTAEETKSRAWDLKHSDDITGLLIYEKLVVTSAFNGELVVWDIQTGNFERRIKPADRIHLRERSAVVLLQSNQWSKNGLRRESSGLGFSGVQAPYFYRTLSGLSSHHTIKEKSNITGSGVKNCCLCSISLQSRPLRASVAQIVTGNSGSMLRFWNISSEAGLLCEVTLRKTGEDDLLYLCTDSQNDYLFVADSGGYMNILYIAGYFGLRAINNDEVEQLKQRFPFFSEWLDNESLESRVLCRDSIPLLVNRFQAHTTSLVSVAYAEFKKVLITASTDGNVRLFTLFGEYLHTFGTSPRYRKPPFCRKSASQRSIPGDLERVGTQTTLNIVRGTHRSEWRKPVKPISRSHSKIDRMGIQHFAIEEEPVSRHESVLKGFFSKKFKHRKSTQIPRLPPIRQTLHKVDVFQSLKVCDVDRVVTPKPPDIIESIERQKELSEQAKKAWKRLQNNRFGKRSRYSLVDIRKKPLARRRMTEFQNIYKRNVIEAFKSPHEDDECETDSSSLIRS